MLSRRALLKAKFSSHYDAVRLPWVRGETEFVDNCSRCGDCIQSCPEKTIIKGDGGFPELNFKLGECIFCAECVKSCNEDLFLSLGEPSWSLKASINEDCLAYKNVVCVICKEQCETEAISFVPKVGSVSQPMLGSEHCTGCGACLKPCPSNSITFSYQLNQNEQYQNAQLKENAS